MPDGLNGRGHPTRRTQTGCMDSPDKNLGTLNPQVPGSSPGGRTTLYENFCRSFSGTVVCCHHNSCTTPIGDQVIRPRCRCTLRGAYHRTRNRGSRFTGQIDSAHRGLPFGSQPSRTIHGSRRDAELALAKLRVEHSRCLTPLSDTTLDVLIDQFLSAPTRSGSPRGPGNGESAGLVLWRYRNTACIFML